MLFDRYLRNKSPHGEHTLVLHKEIDEIKKLEGFISSVVQDNNIDPSHVVGLNLALEEAVTNVIMYAYPDDVDGKMELRATYEAPRLEFVLADWGVPFDPTSKGEVDVNLAAEDRPVGGLGIHLVRNLMDSVKYERKDGKNILTMTKII